MKQKEFWKSKTFWLNVIAPIALAMGDAWVNGKDSRQIVAVGLATLAIVVRTFTSSQIVYKLKVPPKPSEGVKGANHV